ncbi:MAG: response regulator [Verrucomicrobiales bacterium]|nr:response regulator [Verrucomicrobiales bacterium]
MKPKPPISSAETNLRARAEAALRDQHLNRSSSSSSDADRAKLIHELQVHQIELEMQQEELTHTCDRLELEREKYSDLYDFAPVSYLSLDREGGIAEVNLTCTRLLETERSKLLHRPFSRYVESKDQQVFGALLRTLFELKSRASCELALCRAGRAAVEVRIEGLATASGRECRLVLTDITERKRTEAQQLVLGKLESTGILAGGIAHDFNNLLSVILMNTEVARCTPSCEPEAASHLDAAMKALLLARGLTQQLLTFAKGGAPIRTPTEVGKVIEESSRLALGGRPLRYHIQVEDDLWPVEVDPAQLGQVVRNIVQNAAEATTGDGLVEIRAVNRSLTPDNGAGLTAGCYIQVTIADQGTGIPPEVLGRIFDPYFSTKERGAQKGMGLGLTICHSVVRMHEGTIRVESKPGVGTTFHIYLPACDRRMLTSSLSPTSPAGTGGRILVMEDEAEIRKILGTTLQRMGYTVQLVEDGLGALSAYELARSSGNPFAVVLLDLTVRGGMGGRETILALQRIDPGVKAIVMSGYWEDPMVQSYAAYGFQAALAKPFEATQLRALIDQILTSRPARQHRS